MGRGRKGGPKRDRDAPGDNWRAKPQWLSQDEMKHETLEQYYRAQDIMEESDWEPFYKAIRTELPVTFRVTGSRAHAETINDTIKSKYLPSMQSITWEGRTYGPPEQIEWYPDGLGWKVTAPKKVVRKSEPFRLFQRFLVGETEIGNLSRQEAVSMIPPLFLDVQPHHVCLDMCAAPGSKTAQIIESLNPHHTASTGLLIANDSDYKRTHMLVHQTGRLPSRGLMVTNLDASAIPNISLGNKRVLQFDRILADVPCSGDGTLRKNLEIWKNWTVNDGNSLHSLQLRILQRGMSLLKPGGRLVYSTCSLNPAEDESVIAAALLASPNFSLVDVSDEHPRLKRRKGKNTWKVATKPPGESSISFHETYEEYMKSYNAGQERQKPGDKLKPLPQTLWPPVVEDVENLHLERCMRLLPHDQDTGGFFVAVLLKQGTALPPSEDDRPIESTSAPAEDVPEPQPEEVGDEASDEQVLVADEAGTSSISLTNGKHARSGSPTSQGVEPEAKRAREAAPAQIEKKTKKDPGFREDPYSYVDTNHAEVKSVEQWFKLKESWPRDSLMVRNEHGGPMRSIYLTNPLVRAVIENNDYTRLRLVSAGVKAFTRQESGKAEIACKWRIPSDGLGEVLPWVGDGILKEMTVADLRVLCKSQYPETSDFATGPDGPREWLEAAPVGNLLVRFKAGEAAGGHLSMDTILPVWKARTSVSLLVDKREKSMLSLRVFEEDLVTAAGPMLKRDAVESEDENEEEAAEAEEGTMNV